MSLKNALAKTGLAIALATAGSAAIAADTNVAFGKTVTAVTGAGFATLSGSLPTLTDGVFLPEHTNWTSGTVFWSGLGGLTVDLGQNYVISSMSVQHDNNDGYLMTSVDSSGTLTFSLFGPQYNGGGMTTSSMLFNSPIVANKLTFMSVFGDNMYSMSEIKVMGHAVPVPEPETYAMFLAGLGLMGAIARRRKANLA